MLISNGVFVLDISYINKLIGYGIEKKIVSKADTYSFSLQQV